MYNLNSHLHSCIVVRANELVEIYKDVPLNGERPANNIFFARIAIETVTQGIWNGQFDEFVYYFDGKLRQKIVTNKHLTKILHKLLTYGENSEELYWNIIFSLSLRNKSIKQAQIDKQKLAISEYLINKKGYLDLKLMPNKHTFDGINVYTASPNNMPNYGRTFRNFRQPSHSDY